MPTDRNRARASAPIPKRFTVLCTLEGFEVVDTDGRPVGIEHDELSAGMFATTLNGAAALGPKYLARALGATEGDDA